MGTPVYKGSYTGLLKHLFDLVDMKALKARNVIVFATGKAPAHGPLVESSMRALFAFFDAQVSENFIFAVDEDFENGFPSALLQEAARKEFEAACRLAGA